MGMNVHQRETPIGISDDEGTILEQHRIRTDRTRFAALFGSRPRARLLLEPSTIKRWLRFGEG
jgi:hypothetical protein